MLNLADVEVCDNLQVVDSFLQAEVPTNIQKKKTGCTVRKPQGSARFDPQSQERRQIWEDWKIERKEKQDKKAELERKRAEREEKKRNGNGKIYRQKSGEAIGNILTVLMFQSFLIYFNTLAINQNPDNIMLQNCCVSTCTALR